MKGDYDQDPSRDYNGSDTQTDNGSDTPPTQSDQRLTGAITDPNDPRLTDGSYASDPNVLDYINKDLAQKQVAAGNAGTANTSEWQKYINNAQQQANASQQASTAQTRPTGPGTGNDQYGNPLPAAAPAPAAAAPAPPQLPFGGGSPDPIDKVTFGDPTNYFGDKGAGAGPPAGVSDQLYQQLLDRAHQGENVDPNDPNVKQQMDPYQAQVERNRRDYLAQVAEQKGPMGNIQGEERLSAEQAGQDSGNMQAQLIGREIQAKRDEIQQSLTQLGSQMTSDQQQQLQKELGYLNASMQKYGIDMNGNLTQQQINSNNDQFAQRFGLDSTGQANYWDAIRRGLIHG